MGRKKEITLREHLTRIAPLGGGATQEGRSKEERREFARKGGKAGGKARAEKLGAKRRSAIAKKAAAARWRKKKLN